MVTGRIGRGFLILLGVGPEDTEQDCDKLCKKLLSLRIFTDDQGKMNLGLEAVNGQVLVVSRLPCMAAAKRAAVRISSVQRRRRRPRHYMSGFCGSARRWVIRRSMACLARI